MPDASPAAAGPRALKVGDIVESLAIGGKTYTVKTGSELINALAVCPGGAKVTICYRRAGKGTSSCDSIMTS